MVYTTIFLITLILGINCLQENSNNDIIISLINNPQSNERFNNITYNILLNTNNKSYDSKEYEQFKDKYHIVNMPHEYYNKLKYWVEICETTPDYDVLYHICKYISSETYYLELEFDMKRTNYKFDEIGLTFDNFKELKEQGEFCQYYFDYSNMINKICSYAVKKSNNLPTILQNSICENMNNNLLEGFRKYIKDISDLDCHDLQKDLKSIGVIRNETKVESVSINELEHINRQFSFIDLICDDSDDEYDIDWYPIEYWDSMASGFY